MLEVVIAVALAGLVVLSLAAAMLAIVRANALNSDRQRIDAAMTSFSESVRGGDYLPCGDTPAPSGEGYLDARTLRPGAWRPPSGVEVDITSVEYWNPEQDGYEHVCPAQDGGAQRLTLTTSWRDLERSAQIVIRR